MSAASAAGAFRPRPNETGLCTDSPAVNRTLYRYDAMGLRVEKRTGDGNITRYLYDNGQLAAEYTSTPATESGRRYLTTDHLGTTRVITDPTGTILTRRDYFPFGEEISPATLASGNIRSTISAYGDNTISSTTVRFTGKERDAETGLDYFGARYMSAVGGRFTSPDVLNMTADRLLNPSRMMNKYVYVTNNPLSFVDLDGRDVVFLLEPPHFLPGHAMLFANNPATGQSGLMSFGPVDSSSSGRFFTALNGPMSSTNQYSLPQNADDLRSNFAAITIQTTPEQAQAVLDYINRVSSSTPQDAYRVLSENCTTVCRDALKSAGILPPDRGTITPFGLWTTLFQTYAKNAKYSTFSSLPYGSPAFSVVHIEYKKGIDYGNPRFGINTFDFIMLRLKSNCTETWDAKTNTLHGCVR